MCHVNTHPWTMLFNTCPLDINTNTKKKSERREELVIIFTNFECLSDGLLDELIFATNLRRHMVTSMDAHTIGRPKCCNRGTSFESINVQQKAPSNAPLVPRQTCFPPTPTLEVLMRPLRSSVAALTHHSRRSQPECFICLATSFVRRWLGINISTQCHAFLFKWSAKFCSPGIRLMFNLSDLVASCNNKHLAWSFRDLVKRERDGHHMIRVFTMDAMPPQNVPRPSKRRLLLQISSLLAERLLLRISLETDGAHTRPPRWKERHCSKPATFPTHLCFICSWMLPTILNSKI